MNPVLLHRCYVDSDEELFMKAWEYGYNGIETNAPGLNGELENIPDQVEKLERLRDEFILNNIVLHFPIKLINDNEWPNKEAIFEKLNESFKLSSERLGVSTYNVMASGTINPKGNAYTDYSKNGSAAATETHWERAVEILKTASAMAKEYDITLAIETHGCLLHDMPEPTMKLIKLVDADNLKINLDITNMVLTKKNLLTEDEIADMLTHTGHVHLKNLRMLIGGGGGFLLENTSSGMIDYKPLVKKLKDIAYSGVYTLEFPCKYGDINKAIRDDIEFAKRLQIF